MKNQTVALLALLTLAGTTMAAPRESQNAPASVDVPGEPAVNTFTLSFTGSDGGGAYSATRIRFDGTMTAVAPFTYAFDTIINVTPPGGAPVAIRASQNYAEYTVEVIAVNSSLNGTYAPAGTWSFGCTDDFVDGDGVSPESTLNNIVVTLDDQPLTAPAATNLGTLVDGTLVSQAVTVDAGGVKWFTVTTSDASDAAHRKLDINTLSSTSGVDSEIGVYSSTGAGLFANDDAGGGLYSQLVFGEGGAAGPLAAGTYYIAVSTFNATFGLTEWNVTSTGPGGELQLSLLQTFTTPPVGIWDETAQGGGDAGQDLASAQVVSGTGALPRITGAFGADDVDMYKINICDTANFSASTAGTPAIDTQLFLFNADGTGVVMNDDNTLGGGGLWSALDNTTGFITATGNYYLAISRYDIDPTSGGLEIWADTPFAAQRQPDGANPGGILDGWMGTNATTGNYRIDLTGVCRVSAGPACGLADVGGVGGAPGADNHLDNNDFVVFIDYFFSQNPIADQGATGGAPGPDGAYDNNDFIVFIDNFFNAPASCR